MAERRRGGLARLPDFGTSAEDRLLGTPAADEPQPTRRRPLKVDESLADQVRDAVLFMRGRGRPELTQNELLDELLIKGLQCLRDEANAGQQFPSTERRRSGPRG
ncbi:MAG: hypothetical protein WCC38_03645 [Pseudonocardiaceae bacterium]